MKTLTFEVTLEADDDAVPTNIASDIQETLNLHYHLSNKDLHVHRVTDLGVTLGPHYHRGLPEVNCTSPMPACKPPAKATGQ